VSNRNERDVLTEFLNSFTDYGPGLRQVAARAVVSLRDTAQIVIVSQTSFSETHLLISGIRIWLTRGGASQTAPVF
jgi:hypothetical protein